MLFFCSHDFFSVPGLFPSSGKLQNCPLMQIIFLWRLNFFPKHFKIFRNFKNFLNCCILVFLFLNFPTIRLPFSQNLCLTVLWFRLLKSSNWQLIWRRRRKKKKFAIEGMRISKWHLLMQFMWFCFFCFSSFALIFSTSKLLLLLFDLHFALRPSFF